MTSTEAVPMNEDAATSSQAEVRTERPEGRVGVAVTGLLVAVAYYGGANIGLILRIPPTTPSVLWPPNAILTATLLLSPVRRWWIYLLAGLPAHLIATAGGEWPLPLVLALYATNCSEAILAAAAVRRWSDGPTRLDTLKRVLVFVAGAGLFGPFVSSFLDAGVVAVLGAEPYWLVWRARFFSNVLSELTVPPVIVTAATIGWPWIRGARLTRLVEVMLVGAALAMVSTVVFSAILVDLPHMPVALFLPIILWTAVRFGPAGVSASTLAVTLLLTWAATHARGPFLTLGPSASVLALQFNLIVSVVPLMCLAGLIEERRRAQRALADRLRFEAFIARLSGSFVHLPSDRMGEAFATWLERVGRFLELDRIVLLRISDNGRDFRVAHAWNGSGVDPVPCENVSEDFSWTVAQLRLEKPMLIERLGQLPKEGDRDRASLRRDVVRAKAVLPLLAGDRMIGGLGFVKITAEREWPDEEVARLQLIAEVFASVLARKENEDALRASELMKSAILSSLDSAVAVLDRQGHILAINQAWETFAVDSATPLLESVPGVDYLAACREAANRGDAGAVDLLAGIATVLGESRSSFELEYAAPVSRGERWFAMSVVALGRSEGGAVVSSTEITERKRAEMEVQRSRQELAHFTRVSAMGELTASIAHELNQPLTGILANARAAQRFLDLTPAPLHEVREILADIVDDDKRAAEVIQRLRDLLRKGEIDMRTLDLNALIQDVVRLLGSDLVIRDIRVVLDLEASCGLVNADRVQLQQVVLNLLLNAMEAMMDSGKDERTLVVRTRLVEGGSIRVSVEDSGPGLRAGTQELVFEAFYTTKVSGMGMGLAIARSIVSAHGGSMSAETSLGRGATFHFSLPVSEGGS